MRKKIILFTILFVLFSSVVHAQKTTLVRSLTRPFARGGSGSFAVSVGNYNLGIPNVVRQVASNELLHKYFGAGYIDPQRFPRLAAQNDIQTLNSFQHFVEQAHVLQHEFPKIAEQIQLDVQLGAFNYMQHLPQDP